MNSLFFSLVFLFSACFVYAQTSGFNHLYPEIPGNNLGNNIITHPSGYWVSGSTVIDSKYRVFLLELDTMGEMNWSRLYSSDSLDMGSGRAGSLQRTNDLGFVMCGELGGSDFWSYVLKLDGSGDTVWTFQERDFGNHTSSALFSICQTHDSGYAAVGWVDDNSSFDVLLVKLKLDGSLDWFRTYGDNTWERGFDIEQLADSGFVIGYQDWDGNQDTDCALMRVDASGNLVWEREFDNSQWEDGATQVLINGNFIYAGMNKITEDIPNSSFFNGKAAMAKLTLDNQLIWWNEYGIPKIGDGPFTVKMDQNGDVLMLSKSQILELPESGAGWVLKISPEGDSLFETRYTAVYDRPIWADSYAWSMDTTLDGGFITAGYAFGADTNTSEYFQDLWVVKFDSNGCFDTTFNCWLSDTADTTDTVGIASYLWQQNSSLELWPNPASDQFNVRYDVESGSGELWLELVDQQGRAVLREPFQGTVMEVNVHHLQSGLYFCVLQSADGQLIARRKLMIGE